MSAAPYIGSKISLISKANIRYEGTLFGINAEESTVMLSNVRSFGTEGRSTDNKEVAPLPNVFEYIVFRGNDIKDLHVQSEVNNSSAAVAESDPAVLHAQAAPTASASAPENASITQPPPPGYTNTTNASLEQPVQQQHQQQHQHQHQHQPKSYSSAVHQNKSQGGQQYHNNNNNNYNNNNNNNRQNYQYRNNNSSNGYQNNNSNRGRNYNNNNSNRGGRYNNNNNAAGLLATPSVGLAGTNPNSQQRGGTKFEGDFDFEGANARLKKEDMEREFLEKLKSLSTSDSDSSSATTTTNTTSSSSAATNTEASSIETAATPQNNENDEVIIPPPTQFYNPTKSFFDNISCEVSDRQKETNDGKNRKNWAQERQVNSETFGSNAFQQRRPPSHHQSNINSYHHNYNNNNNNNYRGGSGNYRGRGRGNNNSYGGNRGGYRPNSTGSFEPSTTA